MFALRRSSLRLATSVPFLRPPRISCGFSDQAPPQPDQSRPASDWEEFTSSLIPDAGRAMLDETGPSDSTLPQDYVNPFGTPDALSTSPIASYRFHCYSTRNNTKNTFTDPDGNVIAWFSGGSCAFKKRNRASYEAGYQCAVRMFEKIAVTVAEKEDKETNSLAKGPNSLSIDLFLKGFGQGREALMKALMTAQGDVVRNRIVSITDRSPIKIGGTRAKKVKRR